MAALAALAVVVVVLPGLVVEHDLGGDQISAAERLGAVNNVRTTLIQAVGGAVVLLGAYVTWRQLRVNQEGLDATREGHITDRFSRAVDQLGSEKTDVRIGGLYALRRIADHSAHDRESVISIKAAFLRTHLPWPAQAHLPWPAQGQDFPEAGLSINSVPPLETRAPDAQVALTGLGVLCQERRPGWLNVSYTDLRRADCDGLWLHHINFDGACLEAASIYQVNLAGAKLEGALASDVTVWPTGFDSQAAGVAVAADPGDEPSILLHAAAIARDVPPLHSV